MRNVSDAEMRAAMVQPDNANIVRSVLQVYEGLMPHEDLKMCGLYGLWRALGYHDHEHPSGQKFTTSLHRFVRWECNRALRKNRKQRGHGTVSLAGVGDIALEESGSQETHRRADNVREWLPLLPRFQREVLRHYYFDGRTYDEIAALTGHSREVVRTHLTQALARLRELCEGDEPSVYGTPA